jgi:hypothetical protein
MTNVNYNTPKMKRQRRRRNVVFRFWSKVRRLGPDDCWEWQAARNSHGYGALAVDGVMRGAHVVSWELANGAVPVGQSVLHRCDNRPCVNPGHLFLGTHMDNVGDMVKKGRHSRGEKNGKAILSSNEVVAIFHEPGSHSTVGSKFGVSRETVSQIKRGARWGFLPKEKCRDVT